MPINQLQEAVELRIGLLQLRSVLLLFQQIEQEHLQKMEVAFGMLVRSLGPYHELIKKQRNCTETIRIILEDGCSYSIPNSFSEFDENV